WIVVDPVAIASVRAEIAGEDEVNVTGGIDIPKLVATIGGQEVSARGQKANAADLSQEGFGGQVAVATTRAAAGDYGLGPVGRNPRNQVGPVVRHDKVSGRVHGEVSKGVEAGDVGHQAIGGIPPHESVAIGVVEKRL